MQIELTTAGGGQLGGGALGGGDESEGAGAACPGCVVQVHLIKGALLHETKDPTTGGGELGGGGLGGGGEGDGGGGAACPGCVNDVPDEPSSLLPWLPSFPLPLPLPLFPLLPLLPLLLAACAQRKRGVSGRPAPFAWAA